jgi:hypothetical protein
MSRANPTPEYVIAAVAIEFDLPVDAVISGDHRSDINARHIAMWLAHSFGGYSYRELATYFNVCAYNTVWFGCDNVAKRMEADARFGHLVRSIRAQILTNWKFEEWGKTAVRPSAKPPYRRRSENRLSNTPPPQASRRRCLKCGLAFHSTHNGNRICPTCTEANRRVAPGMEMAG